MTVLTGTMILGLLTLIILFVIRLSPADGPTLPDELILPDGVAARAVTFGGDWLAVVTDDDRILIFDRQTGTQRQSLQIGAEDH